MNDVRVIAYFAGDPTLTYQLTQWLEVLEVLDGVHPVALVLRDPGSATLIGPRTSLPVLTAATFPELTDLYADLDAKVVLYCNNSVLNFESLVDTRRLHVHVNHGESDKQSMASNNAKAYDRVFVAGGAAVERYVTGLLDFDASRLVRVGRPQLDLPRTPLLPPTERRTVMYAPTWEGDADYNDYTSIETLGETIVRAILEVPDVRLVYKPHPKVTTSLSPAIADAHDAVVRIVSEAVLLDPDAGHAQVLSGDILAVMPGCDAIVTDVSSVGLDWLYLHTDKPIFLTDRGQDLESLLRRGPDQPLRGRRRRGRCRLAHGAARRPTRPRRAPLRSHRDAAPLLRRPAGRRQHRALPRLGRGAGGAAGPVGRRRVGRGRDHRLTDVSRSSRPADRPHW